MNTVKIGTGELSLVLFETSEKEFLSNLPDAFKKCLFPNLTDAEITKELVKAYKKYGKSANKPNTKKTTKP